MLHRPPRRSTVLPAWRPSRNSRRGAIAVLALVLMVVVLAMVAFAVDVGYLTVAQTDLQRSADAAAHAAVLDLRSSESAGNFILNARTTAQAYVGANPIINATASVDANPNNADSDGDIVLGRIDLANPRQPMTFGDPNQYNAVRVRIRRSPERNGEVPLFFARVLGQSGRTMEARATAAVVRNVGGFKPLREGGNAPILPITIKVSVWNQRLRQSVDDWTFDSGSQTVHGGPDGIPEVVLFPSNTGSSGNLGTVNIGVSNNSTSYLGHQIRHGLSKSDFDYHGGTLELDQNGELRLGGNPGLSAGIKNDLAAITGKVIAIPLHRSVQGTGNNAVYTIVKFVGARVMAIQLTGSQKFVTVQPANLVYRGVIQSKTSGGSTSEQIYSPPLIVQ